LRPEGLVKIQKKEEIEIKEVIPLKDGLIIMNPDEIKDRKYSIKISYINAN
jgi:hypothetical protein